MTNDQNQNNELSASPTPPVFDAQAYATAQPVQPLNTSRISSWARTVGRRAKAVPASTKLLLVVIIAGLATGAIASMLLYRVQRTARNAPVFIEASSGVSAYNEAEAPQPNLVSEGQPVILGTVTQGPLRPRRQYNPGGGPRRSKAYRVAVIR